MEEFWTLLLSVRWPSEMGGGASQDLYIFKEGIEPTWEDPGNAKGGRWIYYAPPYLQDRQVYLIEADNWSGRKNDHQR